MTPRCVPKGIDGDVRKGDGHVAEGVGVSPRTQKGISPMGSYGHFSERSGGRVSGSTNGRIREDE